MIAHDPIDAWLERWEERSERGEASSVDDFLATITDPVDPALAQVFRQRVQALGWVQGQLLGASQTSRPGPDSLDQSATEELPPPCGRYRALQLHARGGLGEVYTAADSELDRQVALKLIQARHATDPTSCQRFAFEARVTARLAHPGIVPVHGSGRGADGRPFYAMQLLRGETLAQTVARLHEQDPPPSNPHWMPELRRLLGRFVQVCQAVGYAHGQGVLHRDLKPENVLLGEFGETSVLDWGLARLIGRPLEGTSFGDAIGIEGFTTIEAGLVLGTPAYMSPEQASGEVEAVGPTSDVYGLGATLYFILTGQPPFAHPSVSETLRAVRAGEFPSPRNTSPWCPLDLEAICLRAIAREPARRYQTALELASDLERWLADEPIVARPEPVTERIRRWLKRHRTMAVAAATCILACTVVATVAAVGLANAWRHEAQAREAADRSRVATLDMVERLSAGLDGYNTESTYKDVVTYIEENTRSFPGKSSLFQGLRDSPQAAAYFAARTASYIAEQGRRWLAEVDRLRDAGQNQAMVPVYDRLIDRMTKLITSLNEPPREVREVLSAARQGRAVALEAIGEYERAILDWDAALQLAEEEDRLSIELDRAVCLLRSGQRDKALQIVEDPAHREDPGRFAAKFARIYAVDAGRNPAAIPSVKLWLRQAITDGSLTVDQVMKLVSEDKDFARLRNQLGDLSVR